MPELRLSNQKNLTWEPDPEAFQEACEFLGVAWPVKILQTAGNRSVGGTHRVKQRFSAAPYHGITVARDVQPGTAGRTLWHELTHAAQCERLGSVEFDKQYSAQPSGLSLRLRGLNKFEVEADANEDWNYACPLAVFSARMRWLPGFPG